jgi:hypothetical protein
MGGRRGRKGKEAERIKWCATLRDEFLRAPAAPGSSWRGSVFTISQYNYPQLYGANEKTI